MNITHTRCDTKVKDFGVELLYDYYCPLCDEDLFSTECSFQAKNRKLSSEELVNFVHNEGIFVVENSDGTFSGVFKEDISSLKFDRPIFAYNYCYDFIENGFKSL